MAAARPASAPKVRIYIWELPLRLVHWVLFFAIFVLCGTGFYIGHPFIAVAGQARYHFVMGTVRAVHLYTAIVFTLAVLVRIYWLFAGNRYARLSQLIPLSGRRLRSVWQTFLYYCFLRRHPDSTPGHDGLAGLSYGFIFLVYLLLIATGLALYTVDASSGSPLQAFGFLVPLFDGLQMARLIHHVAMWVVLVFVVIHVYSVILWSMIEDSGEIDSMFNGHKFWPKRNADAS
ncbi:MAG TPA: Ni/Fe-hydrogenase, b-type cytochrome subunit [Burkholderiales bacterium]|nr:Ni/Fe-hydrogenase, b-type cytochrome subunit [Burkholderiales bacterium]